MDKLVFQATYEKSFILGVVPHAELPHSVINLEDGGPRPFTRMDEYYAKTQFKVLPKLKIVWCPITY